MKTISLDLSRCWPGWVVQCWRESGGPITVRVPTLEGEVDTFQAMTSDELRTLADEMDKAKS